MLKSPAEPPPNQQSCKVALKDFISFLLPSPEMRDNNSEHTWESQAAPTKYSLILEAGSDNFNWRGKWTQDQHSLSRCIDQEMIRHISRKWEREVWLLLEQRSCCTLPSCTLKTPTDLSTGGRWNMSRSMCASLAETQLCSSLALSWGVFCSCPKRDV